MKNTKIAIIGGGQMGRALLGGMLNQKVVAAPQVHVVEPSEVSRQWWQANFSDVQVDDRFDAAVSQSQVVLLAVKPNVIPLVIDQGDGQWAGKLIVSIAAGVSVDQLATSIGHQRVIRVMPNTPSLVGAGVSAFCGGQDVTEDDYAMIQLMLGSIGLAVRIEESQMDAVTGLSGSGPAYLCLVVEAMADGGVMMGLPRPLALQLAAHTVMGAGKLIAETGRHPGELKDAVASPGGTTIAALQTLEQNGLRAAMIEAVQTSARRSQEMERGK